MKLTGRRLIRAGAVSAVLLLAGCASTQIKHLDADEFVDNAKAIEQVNSAMWTTYIGASHGRAYLEYQDMLTLSGKPKTVVFWTELDGLPDDLTKRLRAGDPPWTPWQERGPAALESPEGHGTTENAESTNQERIE
jgi:hypothetical protein